MKKIISTLSWSTLQSTFKFLNLSYLQKWSIFGIIIGLIAGASAVGISFLTTVFTSIFLGAGAGFVPPLPGIEQEGPYSFVIERPWMLPFIGGLGGLVVGLLFYKIQSRGEGHGTDAVVDAFHNKQGNIRARVPILTAIASPITLGSGGSGGLEGPMSQIGAGLSSLLSKLFRFDAYDRRIAVAAGLAAGIGSIFKVPLGAALFSTEVFYRQDFEVKALVPSVIASVVGYTVVGFVLGWAPIFSLPQDAAKYSRPESLLMYGIIGIVSAAASMAYVRIFFFVSRAFANLKKIPVYAKPAIGGAAVGAIAMVAPQVLGNSYGWLQLAMLGSSLLLPIWIMLGVVVLKIIATSLTIGSGGSAGVFAPTMAIGGLLGAFMGGLFHMFGLFLWIDVSAAAIVGMVAFFSATAKTPISTIVMGSELTSGYGLLAPMMIATVVAYAASSLNSSIFQSQVTTRRESPAHKGEYDISVLREMRSGDAASPQFLIMSQTAPIAKVLDMMKASGVDFVFFFEKKEDELPIKDEEVKVRMATLHDVLVAQNSGRLVLSAVGGQESPTIKDSDSLYDAFNLLMSTGGEIIAVSNQGRITGKISYKDISKAYHHKIHSKS
jgi:CIC family chloride channel protein